MKELEEQGDYKPKKLLTEELRKFEGQKMRQKFSMLAPSD